MVGSVQVTTATTGSTLDPDGYVLTVDRGQEQSIGVNEMITITGLTLGDHDVELAALTSNCAVSGANPQTATVVAAETTTVSFEVACEFVDLEALGKIAFTRAGFGSFTGAIWIMEAHGGNPVPLTDTQDDFDPVWSPDGTKIAFSRGFSSLTGVAGDVWVMDADGSNPVQLTNDPADDLSPAWSPDGTKIAFASVRDGNSEIYVMGADGSDPVNLTNNPADDFDAAWSPDGNEITFASERDATVGSAELYIMDADGSHPARLTNDPANDVNPAFALSP